MNRKEKAAALDVGYDIQVTGRNVLVTDSMKDYAIEKVSKIDRFINRVIDVTVTMDIQKIDHKVDIVMKVNHIKIRASAFTTDMYVSIDMAVDKLQTQLLRYKKKLQDHQAKGVKFIEMNVNVVEPHRMDDLNDVNDDIDDETQKKMVQSYEPHKVVDKEKKALKLLSLDEAIMKMELSQDVFLVYRSEDDRKIKVIYRRCDGNFGIIEPEA